MPELRRRNTKALSEKGAERAETLETDGQTDFGHRQLLVREKASRLVEPAVGQELMRCLAKELSKSPEEMIGRKASCAREIIQRERLSEQSAGVIARATNTPIEFFTSCDADRIETERLLALDLMNSEQPLKNSMKLLA